MRRWTAGVIIAAAAVATADADDGEAVVLKPDELEIVQAGREVYAARCASCHGVELEGQPNWMRRDKDGYLPGPPHDEAGHTWHHPESALFDLTKHGLTGIVGPDYKTRMPAFEDVLSDEEIVQVLSFIKSRWPEGIRRRHDILSQRSRASQ